VFATSVIEIDPRALAHNLRFLRRQLGDRPVLCSVIKGNAYGHGIECFVPLAEEAGVRQFAVFSAEEARRAHAASTRPQTRTMIMGCIDAPELEWAIERGLSFWVFDLQRLRDAVEAAGRVGRPARIHLELETGLHRTGLDEPALPAVLDVLREAGPRVRVLGVCTHYAGAESVSNYLRIHQQRERFERLCGVLEAGGLSWELRHTACSAAALTYPGTIMDLARIGIAQYGFWPSRETRMHHLTRSGRPGARPLRRLLTWKSRIMALKDVPAGEFVGYGTSYLPERDNRIAVVPVGYADGYSRSLSNLGRVLIHGRRASVVGVVNMSALLVDVTRVPGVGLGDEVVLIGKQGRLSITVASFSELTRMVDYETLCRLPPDIPRVVCSRRKGSGAGPPLDA